MSYILDALRKSEQERQRGMAPRLANAPIQTASARKPGVPVWLALSALALVLLAIGALIGWLRPWQSPQLQDNANLAKKASEPPRAQNSQPPPVPPTVSAIAPPEVPTLAPKTDVPAVPEAAKPVPPEAATVVSTNNDVPVPPPVAKPPTPAQTRAVPPKITITVHAYSDVPAERVAGINGKLLREGEEVEPGLKLERITANGVTLNFKGQRIHSDVR